jgi:hypothetical protein
MHAVEQQQPDRAAGGIDGYKVIARFMLRAANDFLDGRYVQQSGHVAESVHVNDYGRVELGRRAHRVIAHNRKNVSEKAVLNKNVMARSSCSP